MDTPQYEQQQLFFTQEEVEDKVAQAVADATALQNQHHRSTMALLESNALNWFKAEAESTMTKEDALGIYNGLAEALGWDTVTSINSTYSVTVTINDLEVGTFDGVEAEDEDEAVSLVLENLDAEASFTVSYGDQTISETYTGGWDMSIDATAVEED